jgi:hypothetical protein
MEKITKGISTFLDGDDNIQFDKTTEDIRMGPGHPIGSYRQLVERVAILSFNNPEYVLFYRGQQNDFHNPPALSSLYPSIFRGGDELFWHDELVNRFNRLGKASKLLQEIPNGRLEGPNAFGAAKKIKTYRILRWAVLQHYDVCATPLLDVTHSLHVASSFAFYENALGEAYIYVLGLPQVSGSVTASSEHGIQIIRLLSICPPAALRPHYQEGYLTGEYPTIGYREKLEYERTECDFGRRLICKFKLGDKSRFWDDDFHVIPRSFLYPEGDEFLALAEELKTRLNEP